MLEIERKFLVASIPADENWPVPFEDSYIVQVYLIPKAATSERVRVRIPTDGGPSVYTHTKKTRVSDGVHQEDEDITTKSGYTRLLKRADPKMTPIAKVRRVFEWAGHVFELDTFGTPHMGLVMLEIELPSMQEPVELPPFLDIVREVTTEKEFSNAALAVKGRYP